MNIRKQWELAHRNTRIAARVAGHWGHDLVVCNPKFDNALDVAMGGPQRMRQPGHYLDMQRRKDRVIAQGLYWGGFKSAIEFNCRCTLQPIKRF